MHRTPLIRRAALATAALLALLLSSGCVSTGTNRSGDADRSSAQLRALSTDNARSAADRLRSYAIADTRTATPIDVDLFGLPQAPSLAKATETIVLSRIHDAGGFDSHKAYSPVLTDPSRRLPTSAFVPRLADSTPPAAAAGAVSIDNQVIGAGGRFIVSRVHSSDPSDEAPPTIPARKPASDSKPAPGATSHSDVVLITDIDANTTVSADRLFTTDKGASSLAVDELGELRLGSTPVNPAHLTPFGRDVARGLQTPLQDAHDTDLRSPDFSCALLPCVALTYDDGPGKPAIEKQLLADAKAANIRLTYFLMGRNVDAHPAMVKEIAAAGHEIADHSYSHPKLDTLSPAEVKRQITRTAKSITAAGAPSPKIVRPPYGALDKATLAAIGKPAIIWDVDTLDWKHHSPAKTVAAVRTSAKPGSVVLMHSIHPTTVKAAPRVFSTVAAEGLYAVTVSELFDGIDLKPDAEYFCRGYSTNLCSNPEHPAVTRN